MAQLRREMAEKKNPKMCHKNRCVPFDRGNFLKMFLCPKSAELLPVAEGNKVDPNCEKSMPHRVVILLGVSLKEEICHASTLEMPKLTCLQ